MDVGLAMRVSFGRLQQRGEGRDREKVDRRCRETVDAKNIKEAEKKEDSTELFTEKVTLGFQIFHGNLAAAQRRRRTRPP